MSLGKIQIEFAVVSGRVAHISEFAALPRLQRPSARCEACHAPLIMKLGAIRAHHFAHSAGATCPLTTPETARHYNSKHKLASKLRSLNAFHIRIGCLGDSPRAACGSRLTGAAAAEWDNVRVEPRLDPIRPDIALLKDGKPILAIEIRATHAVSVEKAAALKQMGVPWIELEAGPQTDSWDTVSPLQAMHQAGVLATQLCDRHQPKQHSRNPITRTNLERAARSPTVDSRREHLYGEPWRFRVIDCYASNGPRTRKLYWIFLAQIANGRYRLTLADTGSESPVAEIETARPSENDVQILHEELRRVLRRSFVHVDSRMRWCAAAEFPKNPSMLYTQRFMRIGYLRDSATNGWVRSVNVITVRDV